MFNFSDSLAFWTFVIAGATIVNAGVAVFLWIANLRSISLSKGIFIATHRPYVGVSMYGVDLDAENKFMTIGVHFRNFGSVPAKNLDAKWQVYLNGAPVPMNIIPVEPSSLFPEIAAVMEGTITNPEIIKSIATGASPLQILFEATYEGINGQRYRTDEEARYKPQVVQFVATKGQWT